MKNLLTNSSEEFFMNRLYALWSGDAKIGVTLLLAVLIGLCSQVLQAQNKPEMPILSLTGNAGGWNQTYYPDGRIWTSTKGPNGDRELLVPVFIKNCWRSTVLFKTFPIYSFKFKVQFDSTALEWIGVDKNGPNRGVQGTPLGCLGKDFTYTAAVARDITYQSVIGAPIQNRIRGKRVMITATNARELPQTGDVTQPCDQRPFTELIYLRFRVVANPAINQVSARTPIILTNDTLYYNDFEMGKELAFPGDASPGPFAGLAGVDNYFMDAQQQEQIRDPLRPSRPGIIWLEVTDISPRLSFTSVANPAFRLVDSVEGSTGSQWFIVDPITIDYGSSFDDQPNGIGTRDIDVINTITGTRAYEIMVQSDSRWLKFKSFLKGGQGEINPFPQAVREGYVQYLDKGILGTSLGVTPFSDPTIGQRDLNMRVICDPNELPNGDEQEICGTYVGYLSFKATSLDVSPVRVKVTFIYFRTPYEPNVFDENNNWQRGQEFLGRGITLDIRNSNNPNERTFITFGVGNRATDMVDTLFGETVWQTALNSFGARFYPKDKATGLDIYPNGLGDLWAETPQRPLSRSRDIRSIYSDSTLLYTCRFNAGSSLNYPVVVAWNTDEFIPGSELFIRDTLNGSRFNVNMRAGTVVGGSRQSFTLRDADVNAFVIEYTLPLVATFPVINKGWNLLSVPVNPSASHWQSIFKNAMNIPIRFSQNIYQTNEPNLAPGVGYFVKYSDEIDKTIAGARIRNINDQSFATRLYDGWNTIGSLSSPTSTENIALFPFGSGAFPAIIGDIYGYVTNRGYRAVTEIQPGLGYWMKISGQAYLGMTGTLGKSGVNFSGVRETVTGRATRVSISDNAGNSGDVFVAEQGTLEASNVFELPPLPPNNLFDVRFSNHTYVDDAVNPMIQLQGVTFPINVTVNNPGRSYVVTNPISGAVLGTITAGRNNTITITDARTPYIRLMGQDADLTALTVFVSPNPASAVSMVNVTVPQAGRVTVTLYDAVGQIISTIIDEEKIAGVYGFDLNAATIAQGRYIVRVTLNGTTATSSVSIVR